MHQGVVEDQLYQLSLFELQETPYELMLSTLHDRGQAQGAHRYRNAAIMSAIVLNSRFLLRLCELRDSG